MVAIVNGRVLTTTDLERYRDIEAAFGYPVPKDEAQLLEGVIEEVLIQAEVDQFPGALVTEERIDQFVAEIADTGSIPLEELREAARNRLERIDYFNSRFRRFATAGDAEISEYYETVFRPAAEAGGLDAIPPLEAVRDMIRENVIIEEVDRQIGAWSDSLMRRSNVEIVVSQ